jgi:HlyD family secretion protein
LLTRRRILAAMAVAGLAALLWLAFRPQPVPVDLATVARGPLEVTVEAEGVTRIRQIYQVSAPLAGYTARSPVEVGDPVTAFETVVAAIAPATPAFLDARAREEAEAAVTEGEAALRAAEARVAQRVSDLDYATAQHDRAAALAGRGVIPQSSLDDAALRLRVAETALDAARSEREMAEATLARARAALIGPLSSESPGADDACCVEITAPASGHVLSIVNRSARLVQPGEPLLEIGEPGDLEIEVDLLSSDAVRIAPGAAAYVERWGGPPLAARVRRIDPAAFTKVSALGIEEQRVRVYLDFVDQGSELGSLGDSFRVYVRIVEWRGDNVLQVPISSLFRTGDLWTVFRAIDGRARLTSVEIGRRNAEAAEVMEGLADGDRIVTYPGDRVVDGATLLDRGMAGAATPSQFGG